MSSFNLTKATEQVSFNLTKRGITDIPKDINVSLLLDFSYSMSSQYSSGAVARVLQRLLSISNTIDDDGLMELVVFHHDAMHYGTLNVDQYDEVTTIVEDICRRYSMGGTNFAPAINKILDILGQNTPIKKVSGFFKNLFSSQEQAPSSFELPGKQLLVLLTDGENSDSTEFNNCVKRIESLPNVYLQCVAVGYDSESLRQLAATSSSVGYSSLSDFSRTDDDLIESVVNTELLTKFAGV